MKKPCASVTQVGVDVHYAFSTAALCDGQGRVVGRERLEHRDRETLRRQLSRWPKGVPVVMEASFGWGWLSDEMKRAGLDPHLANCFKVEKMRKAWMNGVKNNRKDAELLSRLWSEKTRWWEVWLVSPEVRDQREWMRNRADLVKMQTEVKERIHAIFHRHGIFHDFSDLFGARGRAFLMELCVKGDERLSAGAWAALQDQVGLLNHLRNSLATIAGRLRTELDRSPLIRRLQTVPGIGLILAHVLRAEIGQIERFQGERPLASYALLGPICQDTGEEDPGAAPRGRHLGYRGNRTLKWAFIEAAHGAVRKSARYRKMFDEFTDGGKRNCGRGHIKVARHLVRVVRSVWKNNTDYRESPSRPESGRRKEESRSGTGLLCMPMAAVREDDRPPRK